MSDLFTLVATPIGQQSNVSAVVVSTADQMRMADQDEVLFAPHHGQFETRYSSLYDLFLRTGLKPPQSDFYSAVSNFDYLRRKLDASSDAIKNAIDMDIRVMHGNPVFRGTRIPIYQIFEELAYGTPMQVIPDAYPSLSGEQIQAGLEFAASVLRIYDE